MDSPRYRIMEVDNIDANKLIFAGVDTTGNDSPRFSTSEVAKFFFARSPHWMRWRERKGDFVIDGQPVVPERTEANIRSYTLGDVERLAHALATNHAITTWQLMLALRLLQLQGEMHQIIGKQ